MSASDTGSRRRRRGSSTAARIIVVVFIVVWIFPIYWMLNTSFKPGGSIMNSTPAFLPIPASLDNFVTALTKPGFLVSLANSVVVVLGVVVLSIGLGFLAAAAVSRFRFRGRRAILVCMLAVQMIPSAALLIPLFLAMKSLNMLDSFVGLGLAYTASVLPFTIWTLRGFFVMIPKEVEEAAMIDGAGTVRILRSILFPLLVPGMIATSVFAFITAWNDYIVAYVMMKDQGRYTLPIWLVSFSTNSGTDYGGLIAASVLFALPVVIFFLIVQRNLVAGMAAGAVKG
ncbi:carbohydrate ABC transporter permease [Leifsonia poae]|uniref:carbohydrate ABC transporter permease n=1 Tax=Leifsonia poae TaxID=110933 RepID=UPI001CBACBE9|nr:carbohydrate ABC transporter permease [Leifsonia poae]